jgi:hypothetical protein
LSKVDTAMIRRVTKDWAGAFGGFDVWRPLRLIRRIGPVLQGITLDRSTSGDAYYPTAHVHALTREFPVIAFGLEQRLVGPSGMPEKISFSRHSADFPDASKRLAGQSRLSLGSPPSVEEVVDQFYTLAIEKQEKGYEPGVNEMEDGLAVAAVLGDKARVDRGFELARELLDKWPKSRLPFNFPGTGEWLDGLAVKVGAPEIISNTVDEQIVAHKLTKVKSV